MDAKGWRDQLCTCTSFVADALVLLHCLQHLPIDRNCDKRRSQGIQSFAFRQKRDMKRGNLDLACTDHSASFCKCESLLRAYLIRLVTQSNIVGIRKVYVGISIFLRIFHVEGHFCTEIRLHEKADVRNVRAALDTTQPKEHNAALCHRVFEKWMSYRNLQVLKNR